MTEDRSMIDDRKYPIVMFGNEMFKELEKHDLEKNLKFYSMSVERLYQLLHDQAESRIMRLGQTLFREDLPLIEIERQCVHLANYCYFLWSQSKKMREDKKQN
jgi:hypothetical protein